MIDGVGLLPYSERLETLKLTTLIERHARVNLNEVFKAKKEFSSINGVFKFSRSGMNLISTFNNYTQGGLNPGFWSNVAKRCHL